MSFELLILLAEQTAIKNARLQARIALLSVSNMQRGQPCQTKVVMV